MSSNEPPVLGLVLLVSQETPGRAERGELGEFSREVLHASDVESALEIILRTLPDLVIVDETVPENEVLRFLTNVRLASAETAVVVVSAKPSVDRAVRLVRAGAYDLVPGPLNRERLSKLVVGLVGELSRKVNRQDRFFCPQCPPSIDIVGKSEGLSEALEMLRLVSQSRCNPILILGETGTGKELAARAVHVWRSGEGEKFVAINCAALTANLLESELFGHVKGSFTGADRDKQGLFALAGEGTILLDEISEMRSDLQAKLLRVLQERTFRQVGGTRDLRCEATIIASSNRNLQAEVGANRFRRDLYYRLAVFPITLPPLRSPKRRDDIPLLAEYFLTNSTISTSGGPKTLSKPAGERLLAHSWPGNVRELRNVIDRALILSKGEQISPRDLIIDMQTERSSPPSSGALAEGGDKFSLEAAEREFILRALKETGWQRTRAAALLGITRATLHAKLKRYDIRPPGSKNAPAPTSNSSRMQEEHA